MDTQTPSAEKPTTISYRLKRDAEDFVTRWQGWWQNKRFRLATYAAGALFVLLLIFWVLFARNLPDAEALIEYESPLPTVVRDINGEPFHSYARERRVQLEYADFPKTLIHAYLAAEDKTFFSHGGIDYPGIVSAIFDNIFSDKRSRGASTITQQVAKNLLLTNEYSYTRKVKEAILAKRIESALTKPQILSLYLNEIALGRQSFGVEAAAQAYFGKSVDQLLLHEMAFLAILPKAPERYGRAKNADLAMSRRNWVLGEMRANGWITDAQLATARAQPLGLVTQRGTAYKNVGGYFAEEVRRQLIEKFGETDEAGPYSVYSGGLWVRSSMHPEQQIAATKALRDGLLRYNAGKAWKANLGTIDVSDDKWPSRFASTNIAIDYANWRAGVALGKGRVGFADGSTARLDGGPAAMKAGDVIAVAPNGTNSFVVRSVPEVGGGMIVQNPFNGRVLAVQGGFDNRISSFNRATQAQRQPGSTIKPFVYATALDNGMTPTSIIVDGPYCVWQGANLGQKCFRNFTGGGAGPQTMRWGLEQSRNLMTVRAAAESGMDNVTDTLRDMSIGDYPDYLSYALGAGDTTVLKMVNAYSMLVNHGRELKPTFIDFAQNRKGKVIWPAKWKPCKGCRAPDWDGRPMPRFAPAGKQVMDPITAYQVVHMLEGVIQRGTAVTLRELNRPLFGKTGTTTGPTNVWFIGGSPHLVAGLYLGFDQPRNMGGYAQGSSLAAPIFKQFARTAMADMPKTPFIAPAGTRLVRVDRRSGKRVYGAWPSDDPLSPVIWEAFKAETEPKRSIRQEELAARDDKPKKADETQSVGAVGAANAPSASVGTKRDQEFIQQEGGIY
ncbi:penicillin-binding protein 1A [Sphingorhabdus wooponensis]|uniref:peptidoglycan glycosyltransferase n=1 Tax=Sphingorhabdus wooponensis TaxID=940136 RepID=A0A426RU02_9SPHN|nr:transglycosylase domain-containing protein [Sphingorhabdus wooponensis]RRQ52485.1 penicillin-binding protein [Sphingorhabdus wooponensis]